MLNETNATFENLLDFAQYLIETSNTTPEQKEEGFVQIRKFRELVSPNEHYIKHYKNDNWLNFVEGWITTLNLNRNINFKTWLRKEKLKKLK